MTTQSDIRFLKGVGEARAALYAKLEIYTINDLIMYFPRDYIDISRPFSVEQAPASLLCAVRATLAFKSGEQRVRKGLSIFKLTAFDESGELKITIFNAKYLVDSLLVDHEYIFYGKFSGYGTQKELLSPMIFDANTAHSIVPVYPQTAGIKSTLIRKNIEQALTALKNIPDPMPEALRKQYNLDEITLALQNIHFPTTIDAAKSARERFVFEELLVLCCALSGLRKSKSQRAATPMNSVDISPFINSLPFSPTNAQMRCINEIAANLQSTIPMNRLLQGDVGSGKTFVAATAVYISAKSAFQCALMAPTEILAEQHFHTISAMLASFDISIALLTSSTPSAKRREILQKLAVGSIDLCIGTHALLSADISYHNLGLVITDEQHRFGVNQRAELSQKSDKCHVLVMSATPIPRTLSLIIYGDLQLSVIDELPPGRQPVETLVISSAKRERALNFVRDLIDKGQQAYIVCPLIETGEANLGLQPATEYAKELSENEFSGYNVGLLHGRMSSREKEAAMNNFKSGKIQLLVSTTVIEVGVDVPNATVILIENAERFGLSQLHQLRGRIGRGIHKSWCILISDARGQIAKERLNAMKNYSDGFLLSELDLKLRGPGDFFGERQHGLPSLKVASLADNIETLQKVQVCAANLLEQDPELGLPQHALIRKAINRMFTSVGGQPN